MQVSIFAIVSIVYFTDASKSNAQYNGFFTNVRPIVERRGLESPTHISADGLTLYLDSDGVTPPFGIEQFDLYSTTRQSISNTFSDPRKIEELSHDDFRDCCQFVSANGLTTYFASNRPTDAGNFPWNIWMATRKSETDSWSPPFAVDVGVDGDVWQPRLSHDELTVYFTGDRGPGTQDDIIYATRDAVTDSFSDPHRLEGVSSEHRNERSQSVSTDELAIFYWASDLQFSTVEIHVAVRDSKEQPFRGSVNIDEFGLGSNLSDVGRLLHTPVISPHWPAAGSQLYFGAGNTPNESNIYAATWMVLGDLNSNGRFDDGDIDELTQAIRQSQTDRLFDINQDGLVNRDDLEEWVLRADFANSYFGDANLDGEFNSGDLIAVFQAAEYEDEFKENSTWSTGDWNGDGDFNTGDLVLAFQNDGFEKGPRASAQLVPEPSSLCLILICSCFVVRLHNRTTRRS